MHILSIDLLRKLQLQFPEAGVSLAAWWHTTKHAKWKDMSDVQKTYPNAKHDKRSVGFVFPEGTLYVTIDFPSRCVVLKGFEEN